MGLNHLGLEASKYKIWYGKKSKSKLNNTEAYKNLKLDRLLLKSKKIPNLD